MVVKRLEEKPYKFVISKFDRKMYGITMMHIKAKKRKPLTTEFPTGELKTMQCGKVSEVLITCYYA